MKTWRNIVNWGLICFCLCGLHACHTDYLDYDTGLKDGVYFTSDSVHFQFGMNKGEDFNYNIAVRILGLPKNHDRAFDVEWIEEGTTAKKGLHYDLPEDLVIPAGQTAGNISFVLHRYLDPELAEKPFVIKMRLKENENFRVVMLDSCKFEFSDEEMPRPVWWSEHYLGPYSQLLMIDILNSYWDLEETRPALFERIAAMYGRNLLGWYDDPKGSQYPQFPVQQRVAFVKYVITPVYEYYQEHPHEGIDIPEPEIK